MSSGMRPGLADKPPALSRNSPGQGASLRCAQPPAPGKLLAARAPAPPAPRRGLRPAPASVGADAAPAVRGNAARSTGPPSAPPPPPVRRAWLRSRCPLRPSPLRRVPLGYATRAGGLRPPSGALPPGGLWPPGGGLYAPPPGRKDGGFAGCGPQFLLCNPFFFSGKNNVPTKEGGKSA